MLLFFSQKLLNEMIYEMNHILNCGYEINSSYDPYSYERNFNNCVDISLKISGLQQGLNPRPCDIGAML